MRSKAARLLSSCRLLQLDGFSMQRIASRAFPVLLFIVAPLILLSPVLVAGRALFWGTPALQFMPWREFAWETLRTGYLPLWNPWLGMGAPLFANYQSALAYPLTWTQLAASWLGGIQWSAWWQGVLVMLHWMIAATGMARLAHGLGLGRLGQAVSGLAFGLGGYLVARAGFLSINAVTAWVPWIVYYSGQVSSHRLRGGASWVISLLKLSLVSGLQLLAGHAQIAWYTLLLAGAWSGYWGWVDALDGQSKPLPPKHRMRIAGLLGGLSKLAAGYALGAALAAVQLIPTAEYLMQSQRAGQIDFEYAMTYSFWPWRFLTLLAPELYGSPMRGDYWGYAYYWEDALYIGLLPLLLAVSACLGWLLRKPEYRKQLERGALEGTHRIPRYEAIPFLIILLLVSFLLSLGKNTPIFPWLYWHVPTFDMFQAPTRFNIWAEFSMVLLAGFGAQHWRRPTKRALYWTRLGIAGSVAVMIGAGLTWYLLGDVSPTFIRGAALMGMWGVGAGVLCLLAPENATLDWGSRVTGWMWAVGVFITADLIVAGWGLNPGIDTSFYSESAVSAEGVRDALAGRRLFLSPQDEDVLKFDRFLHYDTFGPGESWEAMREVLLPNLNVLERVASLSNYDPLVPMRYSRWMTVLADARGAALDKMLDLSGVGVVESISLGKASGVSFLSMPELAGARARWVPCARWAEDGEQALQLVVGEGFNPQGEVILEGQPGVGRQDCEGSIGAAQVALAEESSGSLVLQVEAERPGWLLLSDTWYPGWTASVDGVDVPIYRANYLFRAVSLPAGEHQVRF
ncbi:MAG: hypothetical protein ACWGO1_09360, partial [Anaerolineales bacterium]